MTEQPVVTPFYLDKGLWVAFLTPILALLNQKFGLALDATALVAIVLPAVAYILGHKWKTGTIQAAQADAKVEAAQALAAKAPGAVVAG